MGRGSPACRWHRIHALAQTRKGCLIFQSPLTSTNTRPAKDGCFVFPSPLNASEPVAVQSGLLNLNASSGAAAGSISSVSVASGATLLVSRSDQVNNTATVTLSGGTIRAAGGVTEVFGNLNVGTASFLDFGATSLASQSRLSFGTYTPSALLTIDNFNYGSTLIFKSDLTSSINNTNSFVFNNGGIASTSWNQSTSTFTITAIPEPSTYIAALGLLGLCLLPLVRRKRAKVA